MSVAIDDKFIVVVAERLNSGISTTVNQKIYANEDDNKAREGDAKSRTINRSTNSTGGSGETGLIRLNIDEEVLVEIRAQIETGCEYSQTKVLTPQ